MNTCNCCSVKAVLCALLLGVISSLAAAQSDTDSNSVLSSDAIKPDKVLSPEQTDPPPIRSPGYSRPDEALSPDQNNPPPVRSEDYVKPAPALSPD